MTDRAIIDWPAWTDSPPGRYVLDWEQTQLDRVVSDVFGYHALQLGLPQLDALRENRMPYRGLVLDAASAASSPYAFPRGLRACRHRRGQDMRNSAARRPAGLPAGLPAPPGRSALWCDLLDLPFEAQSVDLIVMPHTLEFTRNPHGLLREAERVLMPEGQHDHSRLQLVVAMGRAPVSRQDDRPAVHARGCRSDRLHAPERLDQTAELRP